MPERHSDPPPDFDIEQWAAGLDDAYVDCRVWGHSLDRRPRRIEWDTQRQAYRGLRRCRYCKIKRYVYFDRNWYVKGNDYDYPDGYLRPKGSGPLVKSERAMLRREAMRREGVVEN